MASTLPPLFNEEVLFLLDSSRKAQVGVSRVLPHNVSFLTPPPPQELLESRLKVLKKDLEDYEVFRSTEEKESKELLVS